MRIVVTDKGLIWNHKNPALEKFKDNVIEVCLNGRCVTYKYKCLCTKRKEGTNLFQIKQVKEEKTITAEYLLSYILPLFAFDFTTWHGVILFGIFFMTLGFLCIKHNYFSVNIVLEITHFSFYDCILENEDGVPVEKIIISHRKLGGNKGDMIFVKSLNNEISLEIKQ